MALENLLFNPDVLNIFIGLLDVIQNDTVYLGINNKDEVGMTNFLY